MAPVPRAREPFAIVPVVGVAAALGAVLLWYAAQYGFHRDELYFVVAGRHPAFGYPDQPPLTPLLAAGAEALLGPTPVGLRIVSGLAVVATTVLAALTARELGGGRAAQITAAVAMAVMPGILLAGHLLATATIDILVWAVVLWLVARILGGGDPRLWLVVGVIAGVGLLNKHLVVFLGASLAAGLLLARRDVLRRPEPWVAVLIALLIWLPNLAWQAANGWPQLEMGRVIAERDGLENRVLLLPMQLILVGLMAPVLLAGVWRLLAGDAMRPWRPIGLGYVVVLALILLTGGKGYYAAGYLPALIAAGAIPIAGWISGGAGRRIGAAALAAGSAFIAAVISLPILPASSPIVAAVAELNSESVEQVGWPELVDTVAGVVDELEPAERAGAVVITGNYGEAGALTVLGGDRDLPPVHSGHQGFHDWGPPPEGASTVVVVGIFPEHAGRMFSGCRTVASVDNGQGVENEEQGLPVLTCGPPIRPWSELWPTLRHLN
jgi:4-amino-4-deoxy-L-arabinose transferase-like glycosyltransferase